MKQLAIGLLLSLAACSGATTPLDLDHVQASLSAVRNTPPAKKPDIVEFMTRHDVRRWKYDTRNQVSASLRTLHDGTQLIYGTTYDVNADGSPFFATTTSVIYWYISAEDEFCSLAPFDGTLAQCITLHDDKAGYATAYQDLFVTQFRPEPRDSLEILLPVEVPLQVRWQQSGEMLMLQSKLSGYFDFADRQLLPNTTIPLNIPGQGQCLLGIGDFSNDGHDIITYCDSQKRSGRVASQKGTLSGTITFGDIEGSIEFNIQDAINRYLAAAEPHNLTWR